MTGVEGGAPAKSLGVLGGMGPAATADFLDKLAALTPASRDQDHIPTIVYSDPRTPDRSDSIVGQGTDPLPAMVRGIEFLTAAGVEAIAIPCNSAHYWYDQLQAATDVPILHIVHAVDDQITALAPHADVVGLLATDGSVRSGIYHRALADKGRTVVQLDEPDSPTMAGIRAVKAGDMGLARKLLIGAIHELADRGAQAVIYGCTDVSAALELNPPGVGTATIDSAQALAQACIGLLAPADASGDG